MMTTAIVTSRGRITLPQAVCVALGLQSGDKVEFVPDPGGGYRLLAFRKDVRELKGLFVGRAARPATLEEMDTAVETFAASRSRA